MHTEYTVFRGENGIFPKFLKMKLQSCIDQRNLENFWNVPPHFSSSERYFCETLWRVKN